MTHETNRKNRKFGLKKFLNKHIKSLKERTGKYKYLNKNNKNILKTKIHKLSPQKAHNI